MSIFKHTLRGPAAPIREVLEEAGTESMINDNVTVESSVAVEALGEVEQAAALDQVAKDEGIKVETNAEEAKDEAAQDAEDELATQTAEVAVESVQAEVPTEIKDETEVVATEEVVAEAAVESVQAEVQAEPEAEVVVQEETDKPEEAAVESLTPEPALETVSETALESVSEAEPTIVAEAAPLRIVICSGHIGLEDHVAATRRVASAVGGLQKAVTQIVLVDAFRSVATKHSLSAPVIDTMRTTPGFMEAVAKFPDTALFNVVPEHKSSTNYAIALEAFGDAETDGRSDLHDKAEAVANAFESSLTGIGIHAELLQKRIEDAKRYLDATDATDEVLAIVPVSTLSNAGFDKILNMLETYLVDINAFNVDELRAHPEKIKEEVDGLTDLVGDIGEIFGITLCQSGLTECEKHTDYHPKEKTFSEHDLTKSALTFFLDKAWSVLDQLKNLSEKKEEFVSALRNESRDMPPSVHGEDDTYSLVDHITLMSSYVTLITKLIDETLFVASRLISIVDKATNVGVSSDPVTEVAEAA